MTGPNPLGLAADRLNVPLLRKAVEWAEAEAAKPEGEFREWDQEWYRKVTGCGTAYRIGGYVCEVTGHEWDITDLGWSTTEAGLVSDVARAELGLGPEDGSMLFDSDNTIADIRRIAERIAGGPL